jgi:hypothetical protein
MNFVRGSSFLVTKPSCKQCRYNEKGRCKLFVHITPSKMATLTKVEYAREDTYLCGPEGLYFSDKDKKNDTLN